MQPAVPNPFASSTTLTYSMLKDASVRIALYDVFGKEVAVLVDGQQTTGDHTLEIDAQSLSLVPGMYFCNIESGNYTESVKLTVAK